MIKHAAINPALVDLKNLREKLKKYYLEQFDSSIIEIGDFTYGTPKILTWGEGAKLKIGKFCSIGSDITILLGGEHNVDWATTYPFNVLLTSFKDIKGHPKTKGDVVIGNDVWIGDGAKILSGVHIGDGCVIGGNSLVAKELPPYSICGGNPAAIIKYRFDQDVIKRLLEMKWWNWNDTFICKAIPLLQNDDLSAVFHFYETVVSVSSSSPKT